VRWYFAIDEAGAATIVGEHAKLAVQTARSVGGLEPVLLYHGARNALTVWMEQAGVKVIDTAPRFLPAIRAAEAAGTYRPHSIGHWLRLAIPLVEPEQEFVLYTDCDVIFLRPFDRRGIRPAYLAAAPEFARDDWSYFNGGVMVLNVPAMRATLPEVEALVTANISASLAYNYDDQVVLNEFYRGKWDRLDPVCNWKPYWGYDQRAAILHFHGPKLGAAEAIAAGTWSRGSKVGAKLAAMLDAGIDGYIAWSNVLGDALQMANMDAALRFHRLASALIRYRANHEHVRNHTDADL
jgi:hypothetical protein